MREILFRGKTESGKWVYGNYAFTDNNGKQHFIFQNKAFEYEVIPSTIGQYTGYEKNGNKIFEGDIVRTQRGKLYEIKLYKGAWVVWNEKAKLDIEKWDFLNTFLPIVEVIGNIHDNPEPLKGGAE